MKRAKLEDIGGGDEVKEEPGLSSSMSTLVLHVAFCGTLIADGVTRLATAYAITKALLPLRLILSVSATPWFARVAIVPSTNLIRGIFTRRRKT